MRSTARLSSRMWLTLANTCRSGPVPRTHASTTARSLHRVATSPAGVRVVRAAPLGMGASRGLSSSFRVAASAVAVGASEIDLSMLEGRNVVDVLTERGLVDAITNEEELRKAAAAGTLSVYCGFDPTADSLHLGNLLGILVLVWFQRCGHTPVALLGGATGRVGDPSGKSSERPVLDDATIEGNVAGIQRILSTLLTQRGAPTQGKMLNNLDWFGGMGFLEFLRDVGKYARMGTMLGKDSVRTRLDGDGMSFTEFTYQLLQGYDFVHLYREHQVSVQIGGSDQWGNITAGTDLIRRMLDTVGGEEGAEGGFGLTFPLLLKSDGTKFGKSESGAVWLAPERLGPYKFYQYLFAVPDSDVIKFMRMLTFVPLEEIAALEAAMRDESYRPNTAQMRLAEEVTRFVHGQQGVETALKATAGLKPGSKTVLDAATLEAIADDVPNTTLPRGEVEGAALVDVLVAAGLMQSKSEARRMIKAGGVAVNNQKTTDEGAVVDGGALLDAKLMLLTAGKKNKLLVRVV